MTHGVKVRLVAFVVLSAVGIVYVASNFLGITDRLLGRGLSIEATLPESGGLFTGSEVTYRGVKVGKVSAMDVTPKGLRVKMALEDGTKIPLDSKMYVHNLSAVGEQYLDFEPPDNDPPYAKSGDVLKGDASSLPTSEELLLTQMDSLVSSVDGAQLSTVVREAGTMFRGTANPLQRMVDSGTQFVDEAAANTDSTIALLQTGQTVLQTQADHEQDIRTFANDLADLTGTVRTSDKDIRTILQGGAPAVREVNSLLKGLEPTLPVFLSNLVTVNQVLVTNLPALEQECWSSSRTCWPPASPVRRATGTATSTFSSTTTCRLAPRATSHRPVAHPPPTRETPRSTRPSASPAHPSTCAATTTRRSSVRPRPPATRIGSRRTMRGQGRSTPETDSRWSSAPARSRARCLATMDGSGC